MAGRKSDFTLTKLDDLFTTQAQREEEKLSKIRDIPLGLIDDFPDHPFKVRDDEDMLQLIESIRDRGVITPATVRQKEEGRYELISGHRRKRACELAGFQTLRCEVVAMSRDEATILMVESNFQRSKILPSEKAFAYKMRLDAMKRQAGRPRKENSDPVGPNLIGTRSNSLLAEETGESTSQIKRFIRLTYLVPELLEFVDQDRIKMRPAVELSYLDEDCQRDIVDEIDMNDATPSHDQTIRMRKFFEEGKLTTEVIQAIMSEEKPNQKEKITLSMDRVEKFIPKNIKISQRETLSVRHWSIITSISGRGQTVTADNAFLVPPPHTLPL
jgi:ParB family chromosome partitioning protein